MPPRTDRAAQREALLKLGAAVAEEMRAGHGGDTAGTVGDALAAMPQATLEIVGLIGREARRRRPDAHLVAALAFMCGQALETLRYGVERQDPDAAAMLDAVRGRLVREARSDRADAGVLMLVTKQFAVAKLDIGEELRGAMGDMLDEQSDEAAEAGAGDLDMERHLVDLARELGDDAFAIHGELSETASSFPIDHRLAMASFMLASDADPVRDAALGWLFDPDPEVAPALCGSLVEEAAAGRLGGTALRRLVAVRNWLPAAARPGVDAAVRTARRKGSEPAPPPASAVEDLRISGFDGSGAASVFALVRAGKRHAVASLLFKLGHGVRDAWVHRDLGRAEARAQVDRVAGEIDLVPVSSATVRRLLAHMLGLNAEGAPPPFGALDAAEALGLGIVNPEPATPEDVVALALGEDEGEPDGLDVLADAATWPARYGFMGSWFEDDAAVDEALLGRKGLSRARKVDVVLDAVVAPRRRRWGEMLAWTALITADADAREEATRFALAAAALLGDRPAPEVPLLRAIAESTVEARRLRRG
ncbi:hypothetical protein [Lichenibacterium dinghuense]|uniref:hypothetical protein n=1 Tax=Lichenibacterium dinghuense TaxID=2895977 RepID=UPI001F3D9750|nr:hypothetical protein [Lichenibacterium sp. 6Y81]